MEIFIFHQKSRRQNLQHLPETQAAAKREADVKAISSKQKAKVRHPTDKVFRSGRVDSC